MWRTGIGMETNWKSFGKGKPINMDTQYYLVIALEMLIRDLADYWLEGDPAPRKLENLTDSHFGTIAEKVRTTTRIAISTKTFKNYRDKKILGKREYRNVLAACWLVENGLLNEDSLSNVNSADHYKNKTFWDDYVNHLRQRKGKIFDTFGYSENETLEFKEQLPDSNYLAKLICAFGNTNGGDIIIGIRENTQNDLEKIIVGVNPGEPIRQKTHAAWRRISDARPSIEIYWAFLLTDDKFLCHIHVYKSTSQSSTNGGKWFREGEEIVDEENHLSKKMIDATDARYELIKIYRAISKIIMTPEGETLLFLLFFSVKDVFINYLSSILNEIARKKSLSEDSRAETRRRNFVRKKIDKLGKGKIKAFLKEIKNIPEIATELRSNLNELTKIVAAKRPEFNADYVITMDEVKNRIILFDKIV